MSRPELAIVASKYGRGQAPRMRHNHAEEMALVSRIKDGEEAKRQLVEIYWERIRQTAEGYYRPGMHLEVDDLMQEGVLALLQAAVDYETDSGRDFVEWVSAAIGNGIRRAILNKERPVRLPVSIELDVARILKRQDKLEKELGRKPTVKELAGAVADHGEWPHQCHWRGARAWYGEQWGVPQQDKDSLVNDLIWIFNWLNVIPLEEVDADAVEDLDIGDLTDRATRTISHEAIRRALGRLEERERRTLELRFGFEGEPWRLEEIGQELGYTRERIRQLEGQALQRLQYLTVNEGLP